MALAKTLQKLLTETFQRFKCEEFRITKNVIIRQLTLRNRNCMKTKPMSQKLFFALYVFFSSSIQFCLLLNCHFLLMAPSFSALIL